MKQNKSENAAAPTDDLCLEPSEAALAAEEFASLIRHDGTRCLAMGRKETYDVRPCKNVRGYVLRLPIIGWTIWHPTAAAALDYAERLASIYPAECRVYDAKGSLRSRRTAAPRPAQAATR